MNQIIKKKIAFIILINMICFINSPELVIVY